MLAQRITLGNYRNIENAAVEFSPGINVLWGRNAQGKSNLLESIYFFARGRSFRGAHDRELIRFGAPEAVMTLDFRLAGAAHPLTLEATLPAGGRRRLRENGAAVSSAEMIGAFRAVLFCPAHLSLVSGAPAMRRGFLDVALAQLSGSYIDALGRYEKYLAERNALIRRAADGCPVSNAEWETYAEGMASSGATVAAMREKYLSLAAVHLRDYFGEMTGGTETPGVRYDTHAREKGTPLPEAEPNASGFSSAPDGDAEARLYRLLTTDIERDIAAGTTLHGIHKDDVLLTINGRESRLYASQGQQRSLALALKLAEGEISRTVTGEYPVFLLDDVLSELDGDRRRYVLRTLGERQIIVTSCEPALFDEIGSEVRAFRVEGGTVEVIRN